MPELILRQVYEQPDPADKAGQKRRMVIAFTIGALGPYERPYPAAGFNLDKALSDAANEFTRMGFGQVTPKKPA